MKAQKVDFDVVPQIVRCEMCDLLMLGIYSMCKLSVVQLFPVIVKVFKVVNWPEWFKLCNVSPLLSEPSSDSPVVD